MALAALRLGAIFGGPLSALLAKRVIIRKLAAATSCTYDTVRTDGGGLRQRRVGKKRSGKQA